MNRAFVLFSIVLLIVGCTQQAGTAPPSGVPSQPSQPSAPSAPSQPTQPAEPAQPAQPAEPASSLKSSEVSYNAGAWKIYGTLYESESKTPKKAIVLVPGLGETRDGYPQSFIAKLHDEFPDALVLAIDPRGHGKSTNIGSWQDFDTSEFKDMKTDILSIKAYLTPSYPAITELYVVGASMGSTSSILAAAQDKSITKVVMLSPGMDYNGVSIERSVDDYAHPLLAVASSGDSYSVEAVNEMKSLTSESQLKTRIFPGSAHGTDIFESQGETLEDLAIDFLK
ncbi:MAG: alpha/beta fold hydrolase [Candidatus Micrarchaeota archaeon]